MLLPNKTVSYKESVISRFPVVLKFMSEKQKSIAVTQMYQNLKDEFSSICMFVQTLDCLYALGKINLNSEGELSLC